MSADFLNADVKQQLNDLAGRLLTAITAMVDLARVQRQDDSAFETAMAWALIYAQAAMIAQDGSTVDHDEAFLACFAMGLRQALADIRGSGVTSPREQALTIAIVDGRLIVSIGVDALMTAVRAGDDWDEDWEIVDPDAFATEIAEALENNEQEDGTTDIHLAIDKAATFAIENGSLAVSIDGQVDD